MAKDLQEIKIKVRIANREYPLAIPAQEEALVRKAAKELAQRIAHYSGKVPYEDYQDLLAIVALEFANMYYKSKSESREQLALDVEALLQSFDTKLGSLEKNLNL
jgi:cell division protein ZapA (FtsZ GTPase activity inhibitor)